MVVGIGAMTDLLEQAVETAQKLPVEKQHDLVGMMPIYAGHDEPMIELTPEEEADLVEAQAEMARGKFATDGEAEAGFFSFRL